MRHASNVTHLLKITGGQSALSGREAKPKLLDQLREALRSLHYSYRTEQTYCHWVKRFIYFHEKTSFILPSAGNLKVSYADRNKEIRILCGSI
jgi:hypothetical protein